MLGRKVVLDTASDAVLRERNKTYGEPDEDFQRIAKIATAMGFRMDMADGSIRELTGSDVSLFMIALKTSRLVWSPSHQDSWVDIAGYAACGFETASLEAERRKRWEQDSAVAVDIRASVEGSQREGAQRLGVNAATWDRLKILADKVQNKADPSVLESEGFMLVTSADREPNSLCADWMCSLEKGRESHTYKDHCTYRIRPRRYLP